MRQTQDESRRRIKCKKVVHFDPAPRDMNCQALCHEGNGPVKLSKETLKSRCDLTDLAGRHSILRSRATLDPPVTKLKPTVSGLNLKV